MPYPSLMLQPRVPAHQRIGKYGTSQIFSIKCSIVAHRIPYPVLALPSGSLFHSIRHQSEMQSAYQRRAQGLGKNIWIPEAHDFQTITGESKKGSGRNPATVFLIFKPFFCRPWDAIFQRLVFYSHKIFNKIKCWRSQRESNPCFSLERATS